MFARPITERLQCGREFFDKWGGGVEGVAHKLADGGCGATVLTDRKETGYCVCQSLTELREPLPEFAERREERLHSAAVGKRADEDAHVAGKRDPPVDERGDDVVQSREEVLQAPAIRDDIEQTPAERLRVRRQTFQIHSELAEIGLPDRHKRLRGLRRLAEPAFHAGDHARRRVADFAELGAETVDRPGDVLHADRFDDLLHGLGDTVLHVLHGRADALSRVLGLLGERGVFAETVLVEVHDGLVEVVEAELAAFHGLIQVV